MKTIWILTKEYNAYDQYGEYYIAAFQEKATVEQLMSFDMSQKTAEHVLKEGGRMDMEEEWYYLREEKLL